MFLKNYVNIYYNFLLLYNKKKIVSNNYFNYNLIQNNYSLNIYNFIDVVLLKNFFNFKFLRYRFRLYFYVFLYLFKNNYMSMLPNKINFNKIFNICSFIKTSVLFDNYFNCYKGLICYFLFFKDRKYNYFKKILINKSSFFFKNKIFININKKYFILNNDTYMSYAYIFTNFLSYNFQNSLKLNNSLVLLGDKLKPHNFNYFYNFSNVTNKNFNYFYSNSNYSLNMFKYYTLHNNIKSNSIFTNYIKSFFFFEIFLKKFFELKFNKSIYLVLKKNNVTYLNNNIYYLSLIKRLKKLQIFNKQANLVREVVEVLTLAFFTHDIILLRN